MIAFVMAFVSRGRAGQTDRDQHTSSLAFHEDLGQSSCPGDKKVRVTVAESTPFKSPSNMRTGVEGHQRFWVFVISYCIERGSGVGGGISLYSHECMSERNAPHQKVLVVWSSEGHGARGT